MSDALGIHIAEEADPGTTAQHVWSATISTLVTKFVFAISFAVPLLLLPLRTAVIASVVWGMIVITVLSYFLAKSTHERPLPIIAEHLGIAFLVVLLSHLIGAWVSTTMTIMPQTTEAITAVRTTAEASEALENGPLKLYADHGYGPYRVALAGNDEAIGICGLFQTASNSGSSPGLSQRKLRRSVFNVCVSGIESNSTHRQQAPER